MADDLRLVTPQPSGKRQRRDPRQIEIPWLSDGFRIEDGGTPERPISAISSALCSVRLQWPDSRTVDDHPWGQPCDMSTLEIGGCVLAD